MYDLKKTPSEFKINLSDNDLMYFLHIPKTAGTTLIATLDSYFDHDSIFPNKVWNEVLTNKSKKRKTWKLIHGHFGYNIKPIIPREPIFLTVLRDPIERTISQIEHIRRDPRGNNWVKKNFLSPNETFDQILGNDKKNRVFRNTQTRYIGLDCDVIKLTRSQTSKSLDDFRFDENLPLFENEISGEKMLENAMKRLEKFEFVGISEKFEESMFLLYYTFGWMPINRSWKLNVSSAKTSKKDLSQKTIDILNDLNKLDTSLYVHGKKIFEKRYSEMLKNLKENYYKESYSDLPFSESMYIMLEKHYEKNLNELNIVPEKSINYEFNQKLSGSGWYYREILPKTNKAYRWTGPEKISFIDFAVKRDEDLKILFHIFLAASPEVLDNVKLKVNEQPINLKLLYPKEAERYFEATIPKSILKQKDIVTRFTFEVNRTINPHLIDPHNPMNRQVGLAFDRIKILKVSDFDAIEEVIEIENNKFHNKNRKLLKNLKMTSSKNRNLIK